MERARGGWVGGGMGAWVGGEVQDSPEYPTVLAV